MPKENYTHITVAMDRSGSMIDIASDMEGGLASFIETQKEVEGSATFSFYRFDAEIEKIHEFEDLSNVQNLALEPRGMTALFDAIGISMTETRSKVLEMEEDDRPDKVVCIFITDGHENSSREYTRETIMGMITELQSEDEANPEPDENGIFWEFVFMGANQDAVAAGGSMGVRASSAYTYAANSDGATMAFNSLSRSVSAYRSNAAETMCFVPEDRQENQDKSTEQAEPTKNDEPENLRSAFDYSDIDIIK